MTLLNSENCTRRHVQHSKRVRQLHSPLVETLRAILRAGAQGFFRPGIRPGAALHLDAGEGYFYLSTGTRCRASSTAISWPRALVGVRGISRRPSSTGQALMRTALHEVMHRCRFPAVRYAAKLGYDGLESRLTRFRRAHRRARRSSPTRSARGLRHPVTGLHWLW